jgi:hypothetical protein
LARAVEAYDVSGHSTKIQPIDNRS